MVKPTPASTPYVNYYKVSTVTFHMPRQTHWSAAVFATFRAQHACCADSHFPLCFRNDVESRRFRLPFYAAFQAGAGLVLLMRDASAEFK